MSVRPIKLDSWVREILVDPLSKEPLIVDEAGGRLVAPYGRTYPIWESIYDLRLLNNDVTAAQRVWKDGQRSYEAWSMDRASHDHEQDYSAETEGVRAVYADLPIEGSCLDVGGHQGRLRHFLAPGQKYVTCDPFIHAFDKLEQQPNLLKAYPFLREPVNFICCEAEFLPFRSASFQTVHMRSVIDHFLSPELALNEAYRVLEPNGSLMIGLYVYGGKHGNPGWKSQAKELVRDRLVALGMTRFQDHHVWHPTYRELTSLIICCGFTIERVHWQEGYNDTVCYLRARKQHGLSRRAS